MGTGKATAYVVLMFALSAAQDNHTQAALRDLPLPWVVATLHFGAGLLWIFPAWVCREEGGGVVIFGIGYTSGRAELGKRVLMDINVYFMLSLFSLYSSIVAIVQSVYLCVMSNFLSTMGGNEDTCPRTLFKMILHTPNMCCMY